MVRLRSFCEIRDILKFLRNLSRRQGSNLRPEIYKIPALSLSYFGVFVNYRLFRAFRQALLGSQDLIQKVLDVPPHQLSRMIFDRKFLHHMLDAHLLFG